MRILINKLVNCDYMEKYMNEKGYNKVESNHREMMLIDLSNMTYEWYCKDKFNDLLDGNTLLMAWNEYTHFDISEYKLTNIKLYGRKYLVAINKEVSGCAIYGFALSNFENPIIFNGDSENLSLKEDLIDIAKNNYTVARTVSDAFFDANPYFDTDNYVFDKLSYSENDDEVVYRSNGGIVLVIKKKDIEKRFETLKKEDSSVNLSDAEFQLLNEQVDLLTYDIEEDSENLFSNWLNGLSEVELMNILSSNEEFAFVDWE